jgi:hypothetical protein
MWTTKKAILVLSSGSVEIGPLLDTSMLRSRVASTFQAIFLWEIEDGYPVYCPSMRLQPP